MSERGTSPVRHATFELPDEYTAELVEILSNFAIERGFGFKLELSESGEATELHNSGGIAPASDEERSRYNTELVTWVNDEVDRREVAIILPSHFQKFADSSGAGSVGNRRFNAVTSLPHVSQKPRNEYEKRAQDRAVAARALLKSCMLYSPQDTLIGIRASKIQDLLELNKSDTYSLIDNVGPVTISFLSDFCDELFRLPAAGQQ